VIEMMQWWLVSASVDLSYRLHPVRKAGSDAIPVGVVMLGSVRPIGREGR
jgi:hypothetical protein